ncbi:MAG: lipocalin family protein [Fimbriiglobus sp.]
MIVVVASLLALATAAPVPKAPPRTNAEKIVGTWVMTKSSNGAEKRYTVTVEFRMNGTMTLERSEVLEDQGPVGVGDPEIGAYQVVGNKLRYVFGKNNTLGIVDNEKDNPDDGASKDVIETLTETELVLVDESGNREEYERQKPKKK